MKFFKKKKKNEYAKTENVVTVRKGIKVLNYTPLSYKFSQEFIEYLKGAKKELASDVAAMSLDDLNDDALDVKIESSVGKERQNGDQQYTYHLNSIKFDRGVAEGQLATAQGHLDDLTGDLSQIIQELEFYRNLQQEHNVF